MTDLAKDKFDSWSISDFYTKSWELLKKNKKLLILGIAAVVFASGGGNSSGRSGNNISNSLNQLTKETEQVLPEDLKENALDYAYQEDYSNLDEIKDKFGDENLAEPELILEGMEKAVARPDLWVNTFKPAFKNVPIPIYLILTLEIMALFVFALIFGIVVRSWASGALVKGVAEADKNTNWSLVTVTKETWQRIKSIIWLQFIPWMIYMLVLFGVLIVVAIFVGVVSNSEMLSESGLMVIVGILAAVAFMIAVIVYAIKIFLAQILGIRLIMIENFGGNEAFKTGYQMTKGNMYKMSKLGVVNAIVGLLMGLIAAAPFLIVMGVLLVTLVLQFEDGFPAFDVLMPAVASGAAILFLFMVLTSIINVVFITFKAGTWYYAFKVLREKLELGTSSAEQD